MTPQQIEEALATSIHPSYPDMKIRVEAWADGPSRLAIYFLSSVFSWPRAVTATVRSSTMSPLAASSLGATGRTGNPTRAWTMRYD